MPSSASAGAPSRGTRARAGWRSAGCVQLMRRSCSRGDKAVGRAHRQAHLVATFQAGDPDHVELVEVRREDREELRPLQQRQRRVGGQRQHPGVEVQPAQLAVEVAILGQRVVDRRRRRRGWRLRRRVTTSPAGQASDGRGDSTRLSLSRTSVSVSVMPQMIPYPMVFAARRVQLFIPTSRWPRVVAAPTPRRRATSRSSGVSMSQRRPGHAPVNSMRARTAVALSGVGAEAWVQRLRRSAEQRRGAGAVPVADEAAWVHCGLR